MHYYHLSKTTVTAVSLSHVLRVMCWLPVISQYWPFRSVSISLKSAGLLRGKSRGMGGDWTVVRHLRLNRGLKQGQSAREEILECSEFWMVKFEVLRGKVKSWWIIQMRSLYTGACLAFAKLQRPGSTLMSCQVILKN